MEKQNSSSGLGQAQTALKKYWYAPVVLVLVAALFLAGSWYGQKKADSQNAAGNWRILYYVDPMNPAHTSPEPELAPCGMKMEPVYAEDENQPPGAALPPGSVKITPKKQQLIGVKVAAVAKSPWTYTLRTVGKVAVDETRLYRVKALTEGWIVKVYNNSTTGSLVRKDEPLATFYVKDLPTTLQTFYYAIDAVERLKHDQTLAPGQQDLLETQRLSAEGVLLNLGMSQLQIKDLIRTRELIQEIIISTPATSFVLARNVTEGQKFNSGEELYQLADLSRVWILADLFKDDAKYVRPGEKAKVTLPFEGEAQMAAVSEVRPLFDPATFTLKVRLEMDNPGFALSPGMFVDVEFPIKMPPTVNIPVDAVMDSGLKKLVFVDRGNGFFEPRRVKTGWRLGERTQITGGLKPGERIVVSGNFLIDSESRMRQAAAGMFGEVAKDPVCGSNVDASKAKAAGFQSTYQNRNYYFCSPGCKEHFDKNPGRYAAKTDGTQKKPASSPPPPEQSKPAQIAKARTMDPVCGIEVDENQAKANGLTSVYQGKTYYFSSFSCNRQFDKNPERYLRQKAPGGSGASPAPMAANEVKDPVCGLPVATEPARQAGRTSEYQGKLYYFDTAGCKERFDKYPEHYLSGGSETAKAPVVPVQPQAKIYLSPDMLLRKKRKLLRTHPRPLSTIYPRQPSPPLPSQETPNPAVQPPQASSPAPQAQTPPPTPAPPGAGGHRHD